MSMYQIFDKEVLKNANIEGLSNSPWVKELDKRRKATDKLKEYAQSSSLLETRLEAGPFGPAIAGLTDNKAEGHHKTFKNELNNDDFKLQEIMWELLPLKTDAPLRFMSNTVTEKNDTGTLTRTPSNPDAHFASNNYFFNVAKFLKDAKEKLKDNSFSDLIYNKEEENNKNKIPLVLRYPYPNLTMDIDINNFDKEEAFSTSAGILEYRYPLKYLWMMANSDSIVHPVSLMAMRNFLKSPLYEEIHQKICNELDISFNEKATPEAREQLINLSYDGFCKFWRAVSGELLAFFDEYINNTDEKEKIKMISNILSHYMLEGDVKSTLQDILNAGSKAAILYGSPGTGKTHTAKEAVYELLKSHPENYTSKPEENTKNGDEQTAKNDWQKQLEEFRIKFDKDEKVENREYPEHPNGGWMLVQFHPNYAYEDFIGGIRPKLDNENGSLSYELMQGSFNKFCKLANENPDASFYFIIDEINRADLSAVFGELLYALEYRGESINIPNFGTFTIPENVYIIGTMNNVDKSLVTFDIALRRRFSFIEMLPDYDVLDAILRDTYGVRDTYDESKDEKDIITQYVNRCEELNQIIQGKHDKKEEPNLNLNLESHHQIGHCYFMRVRDISPDGLTVYGMYRLWQYHIRPLLEEYLGMEANSNEIAEKLKGIGNFFCKSFEQNDNKGN